MKATLAVLAMIVSAATLHAAGNLAKRAERLVALEIDGAKGFSVTEYRIETGKFYRWRIVSDGRDEYKLLAPELMRNVWIEQVSIEDKEVKPMGGLYAVEFDTEGEVDIFFLPIRPGRYEYFIPGMQADGMSGTFIVE